MKEKKGITLVSLVVTIVIMLILVGISVSIVIGDDNVVSKANQAKNDTNKSDWIEKISTEVLRKQTSLNRNMTSDELADVLEEYGTLSSRNEILNQTIKVTDGTEIKVTEVFSGTLAGYETFATAEVKVDTEIVSEEDSENKTIKIDVSIDNYTGTLDKEELYYNYFLKSSTDEEYILQKTGQNLTSLTILLTRK